MKWVVVVETFRVAGCHKTAKHKNPLAETQKIPVVESHVTLITPLVGAMLVPFTQDPENNGVELLIVTSILKGHVPTCTHTRSCKFQFDFVPDRYSGHKYGVRDRNMVMWRIWD